MAENGWFPRLNLGGEVVSGYGQVTYAGRVLLDPGFKPKWLDEQRVIALGANDHLYRVDKTGSNAQQIQERPLHAIYGAGGGRWRAARPGEIAIEFDPVNGRELVILEHAANNNDRSILYDGHVLIAHVPVLEARVFDGLVVWRQWPMPSRIMGWRGLAVEQLHAMDRDWVGNPVPIKTDEGDWFLCMTNVDLRLRPWQSTMGYIIELGEDQNFNADALGMGDWIRVTWQDSRGQRSTLDVSLSDPRVDTMRPLAKVPTMPPPDSQDTELAQLLRDQRDVIASVKRDYPELGAARITDQSIHRLNRQNATDRYGRKARNEDGSDPNEDTVCVRMDERDLNRKRMIDVLLGSKEGRNEPAWQVLPESDNIINGERNGYWTPALWSDLDANVPTPPPADGTHRYIGGGNDTGTCDDCKRPKLDPVHHVPEGKVPHVPWLGEDGKGDCDLCFQPVLTFPIHILPVPPTDPPPTMPPSEPPPATTDTIGVLQAILASNMRQEDTLRQLREDLDALGQVLKDVGSSGRAGDIIGAIFGRGKGGGS